MNEVFANRSEEDEIHPLTTEEIAEAQLADASLEHLFKRNAVIDQRTIGVATMKPACQLKHTAFT